MSDLGCRLKQEILYTLNRPEKLLQNIEVYNRGYYKLTLKKFSNSIKILVLNFSNTEFLLPLKDLKDFNPKKRYLYFIF